MFQRTKVRAAVLLLSLGATVAAAQTTPAVMTPQQHWTVDSGTTIGDGANVLRAQVGWPGLWLDFIHGIDPTFDIGGRLTIDWGSIDGAVNHCISIDGFSGCGGGSSASFGIQVLLRKTIAEIGGNKLALTFNPGFFVYFTGGETALTFPIGAQIGFRINEKFVVNASLELPLYVTLGTGSTFFIPILFGGGVEYAVMPELLITGKLALGPSIPTGNNLSTSFALQFMAGVAYKLQ